MALAELLRLRNGRDTQINSPHLLLGLENRLNESSMLHSFLLTLLLLLAFDLKKNDWLMTNAQVLSRGHTILYTRVKG